MFSELGRESWLDVVGGQAERRPGHCEAAVTMHCIVIVSTIVILFACHVNG